MNVYCTHCLYGEQLIRSIEESNIKTPQECKSCQPYNPEDSFPYSERPNYIESLWNEIITKPIKIICSCCGEEISVYEDYINITHVFNYFTKLFTDNEEHDFNVCEKCYDKWIKTFKYLPVDLNYGMSKGWCKS